MTNLRITDSISRLSDANLAAKTNQIIAGLQEYFATAPGLPDLIAARTAFEEALTVAKDGSLIEKAIKNQKRQELLNHHYLMIPYVLVTAAGDAVMALKSCYTLAKPPLPSPELTPAQNQKAVSGLNSGEVDYSFEKVPGARSYMYQCTPDPLTENSVWANHTGTIRRYVFTGLQTGKRYWIRVAAIGRLGQTVFSEPILTRIVQ